MPNITGGLGGQWVWVENLNPSGPLSLRDALTRTDILGPRNIGFKVSGDIFGSIDVNVVGDFTIHGGTSPGGICLRNSQDDMADTLNIQTNNAIIDSLRIRPGYAPNVPGEHRRALNFQGTKGAIVANCSLTWAYDQITGGWYGCEDLIFYRNIIAEGFHPFPNDKYGMACLVGNTRGNVYFYQNIFAHNKGRNPKTNLGGISHLVNNLVYNPGDWVMHIDDSYGPPKADVIGNVLIPGVQSNSNAQYLVRIDGGGSLYFNDNISPKSVYGSVNFVNSPFIAPFYPLISSTDLENHLLSVAGARPLDSVDIRILDSIRNRDGVQIGNEIGGYADLTIPQKPLSIIVLVDEPIIENGSITDVDFIKDTDGYKAIFRIE